MRRRTFIASLFLVAAHPARAQRRPARIGFLATRSDTHDSHVFFDAFKQGMGEHGYVDGRDVVIEVRGADGMVERFPDRARELVDLDLDLVVATNSLAARAMQQATAVVPIVVAVMGDPVGDGLVASLAHPGGNITGLTFLGPALVPKRLALLKEAMPALSRVAALWHPGAYGERTMSTMTKEAEEAAHGLRIDLRFVAARGPHEISGAFGTISSERADALLVFPSPMLFAERRQVVELSSSHRLPSMSMGREFAELGGLMSYGASLLDLHRRAAGLVDRILKGDKAEQLPVQVPTKFDFVINLKTAQALDIAIPPTLLARADEVIE